MPACVARMTHTDEDSIPAALSPIEDQSLATAQVLSNGLTLPPLYFTSGGVKGLFSALREVCCVKSSYSWSSVSGPDL